MSDDNRPPVLPADEPGIARAAQLLREGRLVAVPTETVYGLAARADRTDAVARIFRAKGRPDFNPLIVHVSSLTAAQHLGVFDDTALAAADAFWPGPLTMVVPIKQGAQLAPAVTAGLATVALRCPAHPVMQDLLGQAGAPLAAPSANRSGGVSPTTAAHVAASLARKVDLVLDGGATTKGIESTILAVRLDGWEILRPGPLSIAAIAAVLGPPRRPTPGSQRIEAPGQLTSHYAPGKPLRLNADDPQGGEFFIGFGPVGGDVTLSASGDLDEAAAKLYACLHAAADSPQPRIAVAPVPDNGVGAAINDRLRRAAA